MVYRAYEYSTKPIFQDAYLYLAESEKFIYLKCLKAFLKRPVKFTYRTLQSLRDRDCGIMAFMEKNKLCAWLFCRVIDNFGDIGVSWRLAKQLVCEQNMQVVLWVDDWQAVQALLPDIGNESCEYEGVLLRFWCESEHEHGLQKIPAADAVIETFACDVPEAVLQWLAEQKQVVWLNLEYLTAEDWVDGIHLLPSLQSNGVAKYFFCPGFSDKTGGLSYEQALLAKKLPVNPAQKQQLREQYGLSHTAGNTHVYVFGYADEMWSLWFEMWANGSQAMTVWLAQGSVLAQLQTQYSVLQTLQQVGDTVVWGNLTVCLVPFVAQSQFDEILQAADMCVVRGEDSVLRALWQGQVFWWQIYRQEEQAHHIKLKAFWQRFADDTAILQDAAVQKIWQSHQLLSDELNGVRHLTALERAQAWQYVCEHQAYLAAFLQKWRQLLWDKGSLATQLANFIRHQLK